MATLSLGLHTSKLLRTHAKVEYQRNVADSGSHGNERRHFVSHLYKRYVITFKSSNRLSALNFKVFFNVTNSTFTFPSQYFFAIKYQKF